MTKPTQRGSETPEPTAPPRNRQMWLAVAGILLVHWLVAMASTSEKSASFDELAHLTGGYTYWLENDYRLMPAGGILPQRLAALPVYLGDFQFPSLDQDNWYRSSHWWLAREFFYQSDNDFAAMLWRGRAVIALIGVALGLLVFVWSRQLFGTTGAFLSLVLYAGSPTILANGRLITSDTTAAFGFALAAFCWWRVLQRISVGRVFASAGAIAIVMTAKSSGLLFVPMAGILAIVRLFAGQPIELYWRGTSSLAASRARRALALFGLALAHVLLVGFAIWALYGFRFSAMRTFEPGRDQVRTSWQQEVEDLGIVKPALTFVYNQKLLPESYLYGVAYTLTHAKSRTAFLNGKHSMTGWWYFFPLGFLWKTPIPILLLALGSIVLAIRRWSQAGEIKPSLYRTVPISVVLVVYGFMAIRSNLNIGYRHVLPMLPLLFILLGGLGPWVSKRTPKVAALILLGLLGTLVESARIYPHYLSYFNQFVGGPERGYQIMVDSSLDWGQDLPALRDYLKERQQRNPREPVYLSYFGTSDPKSHGIRAIHLPFYMFTFLNTEPIALRAGVYCMSASMLQGVRTVEAFGPWSAALETRYREFAQKVRAYLKKYPTPIARQQTRRNPEGEAEHKMLRTFERLRLARLCAALRQREPDARVAHSILVFELSDADIRQAVDGPAEALYGK